LPSLVPETLSWLRLWSRGSSLQLARRAQRGSQAAVLPGAWGPCGAPVACVAAGRRRGWATGAARPGGCAPAATLRAARGSSHVLLEPRRRRAAAAGPPAPPGERRHRSSSHHPPPPCGARRARGRPPTHVHARGMPCDPPRSRRSCPPRAARPTGTPRAATSAMAACRVMRRRARKGATSAPISATRTAASWRGALPWATFRSGPATIGAPAPAVRPRLPASCVPLAQPMARHGRGRSFCRSASFHTILNIQSPCMMVDRWEAGISVTVSPWPRRLLRRA